MEYYITDKQTGEKEMVNKMDIIRILKNHYVDVNSVFQELKTGKKINTTFLILSVEKK